MNNKYGLTKMLQSEQGLTILVSGMDPYNENMMTDVLRVTAAVCLVADGHDRILEAVTVNGEMCNVNRFEPVLMALKKTNNPMLQLACLQFINAIVNTPEDIDFKIHLRNEFMRGGLEDSLVSLRDIQLHDLTTHLNIFDDHKEQDYEEMLHRLQDIRIEFNDPEDVFRMLRGMTSGTPAGPHFLSVLQHMLLIRDDFYARPQYFKLVDKCVSQIVLHRGGLDPDFHYTRKFTIDVDGIVDAMVDKARVEEAEGRVFDLQHALNSEEAARNEVEAKLNAATETLDEKEKQFTATVAHKDAEIYRLSEEVPYTYRVLVHDLGPDKPVIP
jgi:polyhydroxyalkanoate synthesis regulator phasin